MTGGWIKMRVDLYRDPKVCTIADLLMQPDSELALYVNQNRQRDMSVTRNVMRNVTVGALVAVWGVMRTRGKQQGADLVVKNMSPSVVDDLAELPGFGAAMMSVGWLVDSPQGLVFPNFFEDLYADPVEKARAKNAERQRRHRGKRNVTRNVTEGVTRNVTITPRGEERRVEISLASACAEACPEGSEIPSELPVLEFHCIKSGQQKTPAIWPLVQSKIDLWSTAYPSVNVLAECRKALAWIESNPSRRKTYAGMPRFLNTWLAKVNDRQPTREPWTQPRGIIERIPLE